MAYRGAFLIVTLTSSIQSICVLEMYDLVVLKCHLIYEFIADLPVIRYSLNGRPSADIIVDRAMASDRDIRPSITRRH